MASRQLPVVAALAAVSAAVALSFGRVLASGDYIVPLVVAAALPHVIAWLVRSRRWSVAVEVAASALGLAVYVTAFAGGPGGLVERVGNGWDVLTHQPVPLPTTDGVIALAAIAVWAAAAAADDLAFRRRAALGALAPGVMVLTWVLALGTDDGQEVTVATFGLAAVCFLALQHQSLLDWRRTRVGRSGPLGAPRLVALGLAAGLVAIPLGVAAAAAVPGGDEPLLSVGGLGEDKGASSYRTEIAPLVDVADKLKRGSEEELFTVRSPVADYWRITALDEYRAVGGGQWTLTAEGEGAVSEGLDGKVPPDAVEQRFDIGNLGERWMPAAYEPVSVSLDDTLVVRASSTLVSGRESVTDLRYTVHSKLPASNVDAAARARTAAPVPKELQRYTELPEGFSDSVRGIAADQTAGLATPFDKAQALRDYFRSGFTYDTNVPPGDDEESLMNFLTERRGFCVQFASTYAVMARSVGIPARVAVGFTPGDLADDGSYRVTNYDAHSWPEIWLRGLGWTHLFDPTPASQDRGGSAVPNEVPPASSSGATSPSTTQSTTPSSTPGSTAGTGPGATTPASTPRADPQVTVEPAANDDGSSLVTWLALVAALVALVAAAAVAVLVLGPARRRSSRRARSEPAAAVAGAWEEALERLREHGIDTPTSETPLELAGRVPRETTGDVEPPLRGVAGAYTTARYSSRPVRPEAALEAWRQVDALRSALAGAGTTSGRLRARLALGRRGQPEPAGWSVRRGPELPRSSSTND